MTGGTAGTNPPRLPRRLGLAGLLPQAAAVAAIYGGDGSVRFFALALAYIYAALILSFLGGMWWGIATGHPHAPRWLWVAAVVPSLLAFASAVPWAVGLRWPGPSLAVLGVAILATLAIDRMLARAALVPEWWMRLRVPLSLGLGVLTLATAPA